MAQLDLAMDLDEWFAIPLVLLGVLGQVGATASYAGYGLSTTITTLTGHSWSLAAVLALVGVTGGAVSWGWIDMLAGDDEYESEQLLSLAVAAAVPLALVFTPNLKSWATSSPAGGLLAAGAATAGTWGAPSAWTRTAQFPA